jgi:hypothetical protein
MASGTILQVDKATLANQEVLWHITQQCEDTAMDSHISICAGSNCQKAVRSRTESLHNITGIKPIVIREKADKKPV